MDDLIDRQAAIVQLSHNKTGDDDCDVVIQNDIETIKALPSAQPDVPDICVGDMISRQAAIDALRYQTDFVKDKDYEDGKTLLFEECAIERIKSMPSAQPEPSDAVYRLYKRAYEAGQRNAQPETAKRIVGKTRDGMTLWYQCDMCNEPVDAQDSFCRGCGRRLTDG